MSSLLFDEMHNEGGDGDIHTATSCLPDEQQNTQHNTTALHCFKVSVEWVIRAYVHVFVLEI